MTANMLCQNWDTNGSLVIELEQNTILSDLDYELR